MALYPSHLSHVLGREQVLQLSASDPIAGLDGVSDGNPRGQQLRGPILQQHLYDTSAPVSLYTMQSFAAGANTSLQDYRPLDHQSAQQQVECESMFQQSFAHATAVEPSQASPKHFQAPDGVQVPSILYPAADTSEIQMKQEPELEDDAMFSAFTNGDFHGEDGEIEAETDSVIGNTNGPVGQFPNEDTSIKPEPQIGSETNSNTLGWAPFADCNIMPDHGAFSAPVAAPHQTPPSWNDASEIDSTMFLAPSETVGPATQRPVKVDPQDSVSTSEGLQGIASDSAIGSSFESVHNPGQQSAGNLQQSAGLIEGLQQYSSAEAALSLNSLDSIPIDTNPLAQQWQQRPQLSNAFSLTEDMVHNNPRILHGPIPISLQSDQLTRQLTNDVSAPFAVPSHIHRGSYIQHPNASQPHTNFAHSSSVPLQGPSWAASQVNSQAHFIPLNAASRYPLPSMPTPNGSAANPNPQTPVSTFYPYSNQVKVEEEDVEMSEDSEPVKVRAPRPRAEPTRLTVPPNAFDSGGSIVRSRPPVSVPEVSMTGGNPDPIDPSSNGDDSDVEPISWKLPSFEASFQEPQAPDDLPTARISIPNLVREHVVLTEDHCRQEMQLFLEVFLPTQQNLTKPDPEPAHAVLNFHTIAVMVLEAFVQWEIGDEMGRGYGFLGGNTALRPPAPQGDEEPERIRSATDADVDDIFFTVIDRWRAGMLVNKGTFKLIRGVQEFCEVALDVIHFVKEHGLLPPEQKKRKERSDKGTARGQKDDAKAKAAGAAKRKAEPDKKTKMNSLQPRKKPKVGTTAPKKPAPKANTKAKTKMKKETGIMVIPRK